MGGCDKAINEVIELLCDCLSGFDTVTVVPSSTPANTGRGIDRVARELVTKNKAINGISNLRRHSKVESSTLEGPQSIETHMASIELITPESFQGNKVLLLDDIRASGNSLTACERLIEAAQPKLLRSMALAQSCPKSYAFNPEDDYSYTIMQMSSHYEAEKAYLEQEEAWALGNLERLQNFAYETNS